jgi:hypothetical protein
MWTIYRPTTRDYPGRWIARLHLSLPTPEPTQYVILADTLEALRARLPLDLTRLARNPEDDPVIEEVWL